jgi:hypothetical protein
MPLPSSRDDNPVNGMPINPQTIADLQDSIVAINKLLTGQPQGFWNGITLVANQHVVLQGTGRLKHGTRTHFFPATSGQLGGGAGSTVTLQGLQFAGSINFDASTGANALDIPVVLQAGKRITAVRYYLIDNGTTNVSAQLKSVTPSTAITVTNQSNSVSCPGTGALATVALTNLGGGAGFIDVAANTAYSVIVQINNAVTGIRFYGVAVDYIDP